MHDETDSTLPQGRARVEVPEDANFDEEQRLRFERKVRLKVDLRLCTIAGLLCSLHLIDSGIISNAAVTSMLHDLQLDHGNRYSVAILVFAAANVCFQLPATLIFRLVGPRLYFPIVTFIYGLITLSTAFVQNWKEMIGLRVLLGIFMSGNYPGLELLISSWYTRRELQLRFAYYQSGQLIVLATGGIVNFGLNRLDGSGGLKGWQWIFLIQGLITCVIGIATRWWICDFPEKAMDSFWFLNEAETKVAIGRIQRDRGDVIPTTFTWSEILKHFLDPKIYGFSALFFLQNLISTALSYFLPIILQSGMGFSADRSILLSAPPYYYAVIPVLITSRIGDKYAVRGPVISFNCLCLITGFCMLGFSSQVTARYIGTYLATGAYISNWAALNGYVASNITGQWKRAVTAAAVTACNGLGGIAGSFIVRQDEAPRYFTAIWVSIGSHIFLIGMVAAFSAYFWVMNCKQKDGRLLLENTKNFRYTY